ncbi:MAG: putative bifunctional diguanylate cyclase/phosphodiesterase [Acidimicrobiia bacterium]
MAATAGNLEMTGPRPRWKLRAGAWVLLPALALATWTANALHIIAEQPWWILVALVVGTWCAIFGARVMWSSDTPPVGLWCRTAVQVAAVTVFLYAIGWGPTLAIGYILIAAYNLYLSGSRAARPSEWCTIAGIAVGTTLVSLGFAPTLIPNDLLVGLSTLAAVGTWFVIRFLGWGVRQRERLEAERRKTGERYEAMVRHSNDIVMVISGSGQLTYVSPAFMRVLGHGATHSDDADLPTALHAFVHEEDRVRADRLAQRVREDATLVVTDELRLRHADSSWHWFEVSIMNLLHDRNVEGFVVNLHDVTERRLFELELEYQAYHDPLTRLPNRASFLERLEMAVIRNRELRLPLAVLFIDVDRFKLVNDSLGHDAGDRLLAEVAERLREALRPSDVIARFGGDEFVLLIDELRLPSDATRVADRVLESLRRPIVIGGRELFLSSSIGIATYVPEPGDDVTPSDLLRRADLAMYLAKERGRARWEVYDEGSAPKLVERLDLEADLWRATEHNELVVHFQPEIEVATGAIVKFEALVRWEHPTRGLLLPDAFIPIAEESELVFAIDALVLKAACEQVSQWSEEHGGRPLGVSVNLSPQSLRRPGAVERIVQTLVATGLPPNALQLEITERTALSDDIRTLDALRELRRAGVRVAIDDFGIGYSALSYLQRFPVDVVKLDRAFIAEVDGTGVGRAIVEAMLRMAHALGLWVTAEGVERPEQLEVLRALGCDGAQGFHLGHVLDAGATAGLLGETAAVRRIADAG